MAPGWDPQKADQPALQQPTLTSPNSAVQPVTCQTMVTSYSTTNASRHYSSKLCEGGTQVPVSCRPTVESVLAKPQKMASPGSVEVGVGTHLADKKSSRSRSSFHSSVRSSDKSRNPAASVPVGAAHPVVADQERELDLSQKGHGYNGAISGAAVVKTQESIIKPAIGVVHEVVTSSLAMSQIGHLERFVHGLVTSGSGSPAHQAPQIMSHASSSSHSASCSPQTVSSPQDSSRSPPKRKPEQMEDGTEERQNISPKRSKYSTSDEECCLVIHESFEDEVLPGSHTAESPKTVMDSMLKQDGASADTAVKQDSDLVKDAVSTLSLPDIISSPTQSSDDHYDQHAVDEEVKQSTEVVESSESCEVDTLSNVEAVCVSATSETNRLSSPSEENPDIEHVEQTGNPNTKETSSENPQKDTAVEAESKQRTSPVRGRSITELSKKRTLASSSVPEKWLEKVGTAQSEKTSRKPADEGPTRSASARRKRDTGGWEWYGEPERKPVYFKVTELCLYLCVMEICKFL